MQLPDPDAVGRRQFLRAAVAAGGAAALSACLGEGAESVDAPSGGDPDALPSRQHAWNDALATDDDGNRLLPEHHVLVSLALREGVVRGAGEGDDLPPGSDPVDPDARETVETALRSLERALAWDHEGLLFTVGYTPAYFDRFDADLADSVALPAPEALTRLEDPDRLALDTGDALLHLASDDAAVVLAAEEALFGEREDLNGSELDATLEGVFERTDRRTGFVGAGKPAERAAEEDLGDLPQSEGIPEEAPLFMGFRSGFRANQASEDRVAIDDGPFAGGTTQHVESLRIRLRTWFDQDSHRQRVEKLFSPAHADANAAAEGDGSADGEGSGDDANAAGSDAGGSGGSAVPPVGEIGEELGSASGVAAVADDTREHARDRGVVGHAQKAARAREDGEPLLLRRDFNTTFGGEAPGLHFLSLQSAIPEFVRVRRAMAGEDLAADTGVGARHNNGILEYLDVLRRGNFLVPPREHRALPTPRPE